MRDMLKGQLLLFMGQAIELDYIPTIYPKIDQASSVIIAVHPYNQKTGFLGIMQNEYGRDIIASYLINLNKWTWAEEEGFTMDDILDRDDLTPDVFEMIDPKYLACRLNY